MSGFSGYIIKSTTYKEKLEAFKFSPTQNELFPYQHEIVCPKFRVAWYSNNKFKKDKGLFQNNANVFGFDGVNLAEDTSAENWIKPEQLKSITKAAQTNNIGDYFTGIKGTFQSFYFNELEQSLTLVTDQTGSKPFFYFENEAVFIFSSSVFFVKDLLTFLQIPTSLNTVAAYQFITFGYLLADQTLVQEIKKLEPGRTFNVNPISGSHLNQYFKYTNEVKINHLSNAVYETLDTLFLRSIQLEYQKDLQNGYNHLVHLSGGLDSRLNVMLASELGYKNQTNLTFGQDQSSDELTARTITNDLGHLHFIIKLGDGSYLQHSKLPLILNNCSVYYFGAAQTLLANQQLNFEHFGLTHNGILAESSKGGYLKNTCHEAVHAQRWGVSNTYIDRIQTELDVIVKRYANDELFALYNRGFNAIHNGTWMTEPFTSSVYTYMEPEFASYAFSIAPKFRFNGNLTIDWMNLKHKMVNQYPWKYDALPTSNEYKLLAARIQNRIRIILGKKDKVAVPVQKWFELNPKLSTLLLRPYQFETIENKQLASDLKCLSEQGTTTEKLLVFNFFNAYQLLFPEIHEG
jgi:asparagine synthase (glutamine-hydrolysing)